MWSSQHSSTSSKKWKIFGQKNMIRFFITPLINRKFSQSQQQCWRQSGNMNADHSYIFRLCPKIQTLWSQTLVNCKIQTFCPCNYMFKKNAQLLFRKCDTFSVHIPFLYVFVLFNFSFNSHIIHFCHYYDRCGTVSLP